MKLHVNNHIRIVVEVSHYFFFSTSNASKAVKIAHSEHALNSVVAGALPSHCGIAVTSYSTYAQ